MPPQDQNKNTDQANPNPFTAGNPPPSAAEVAPPSAIAPENPVQPSVSAPQVFGPAQSAPSPEPSAPVQSAAQAGVFPQPSNAGPISASQTAAKTSNKKRNTFLAAVAAGVLLLGAGAGAYWGVIVPNQPENVLKAAVANTLKQERVTYDGVLEYQEANASESLAMPATKMAFKGGMDMKNHTLQMSLDTTVGGVSVPVELRYLEKTGYVKLGDLGPVKAWAEGFVPEAGPLLDKVSNQWIEIDSTLVKQAKADCILDGSYALNDADLKLLGDAYEKNRFATIRSSSSDKVGDAAATKYEIELDDNKLAAYVKEFEKLSFFKKLKECIGPEETEPFNTRDLADGDKTPLTLWVDRKTKLITKIAGKTTEQDAKKDNLKGEISVVFGYGAVNVQKPEGAKPVMEFMAELQAVTGGLLGGFGDGAGNGSTAADVERQTDIRALHAQIEAYYAMEGKYPTFANINDSRWRAANMQGLDTDALKDPEGTSTSLVNAPAKNTYAYIPKSAANTVCNNSGKDCVSYTLVAVLSTGTNYEKRSLN